MQPLDAEWPAFGPKTSHYKDFIPILAAAGAVKTA